MMSAFDRHKLKIAKDTLKLSDAGAVILGGMTKEQARDTLRHFGLSSETIAMLEANA